MGSVRQEFVLDKECQAALNDALKEFDKEVKRNLRDFHYYDKITFEDKFQVTK